MKIPKCEVFLRSDSMHQQCFSRQDYFNLHSSCLQTMHIMFQASKKGLPTISLSYSGHMKTLRRKMGYVVVTVKVQNWDTCIVSEATQLQLNLTFTENMKA